MEGAEKQAKQPFASRRLARVEAQYQSRTTPDLSCTHHLTDAEGSQAGSTSRTQRTKKYLFADLQVNWLVEIQLLLLTFSTGIQDAISFPDFHCFASNQTGNYVILAVGLAGLGGELFNITNVGISLAMFIAGAILTGQIANAVGPCTRWWLVLSNFLQTVMVFAAAAVQAVYNVQESGPSALGAIALLAFSSGAQIATMRPMRVQEITTAMATAAWVDLVIDPQLLAVHNHARDRRAMFLAALVAGSFAGAYAHPPIGSSNTLILSAVGKLLVTVALLFNQGKAKNGCEPSEVRLSVVVGQSLQSWHQEVASTACYLSPIQLQSDSELVQGPAPPQVRT